MMQNATIEERVSLLELQVENLDEDVDFLFDETVIQDQRLFSLEQETEEIEDDIVSKFTKGSLGIETPHIFVVCCEYQYTFHNATYLLGF